MRNLTEKDHKKKQKKSIAERETRRQREERLYQKIDRQSNGEDDRRNGKTKGETERQRQAGTDRTHTRPRAHTHTHTHRARARTDSAKDGKTEKHAARWTEMVEGKHYVA